MTLVGVFQVPRISLRVAGELGQNSKNLQQVTRQEETVSDVLSP